MAAGRSAARHAFRGAAVVAVVAVAALACEAQFTGPYPCASGYASCVNPQQNLCETLLASDGMNCGSCNRQCAVGAVCNTGMCGVPGGRVARLPTPFNGQIAVNTADVFWSQGQQIVRVPPTGPAVTITNNAFQCGNATAFAVDDMNVYFVSQGTPSPQGMQGQGLVKYGIADGATTVLVPPPTSGGMSPTNGCPLSIVADAARLYMHTSFNNGGQNIHALFAVAIAGGAVTTLAMAQGNTSTPGNIVRAGTWVVWSPPQDNGGNGKPPSLQAVPIAGGSPMPLAVPNNDSFTQFTADSHSAYIGWSTCNNNCGGSSPGGTGLYTGQVVRVPFDGTASQVLGPVTGQLGGMAADLNHVYWSTDTTVWKVPSAGGDEVPIAGNLTNGVPPAVCNSCGSPPSSTLTYPLALDALSVYVADTTGTVDQILKVAK
jgi:hypothetical protein